MKTLLNQCQISKSIMTDKPRLQRLAMNPMNPVRFMMDSEFPTAQGTFTFDMD
jgi:hypothetical protein